MLNTVFHVVTPNKKEFRASSEGVNSEESVVGDQGLEP